MPSTAPRPAPIRSRVLDLIAQAQLAPPGDPITDEQYFLDQLRAAIAGGESPVDRLRARYGLYRPDRLSRLYARHAD